MPVEGGRRWALRKMEFGVVKDKTQPFFQKARQWQGSAWDSETLTTRRRPPTPSYCVPEAVCLLPAAAAFLPAEESAPIGCSLLPCIGFYNYARVSTAHSAFHGFSDGERTPHLGPLLTHVRQHIASCRRLRG
jgi:hypothetical protein